MSEVRTGVVERLDPFRGNTNGKNWVVYNIHINAEKYGFGFGQKAKELFESVKEGDNVRFGFSKNPKDYLNIDFIEKIEGSQQPPPSQQTTDQPPVVNSGVSSVQEQIVRQTAINAAERLVSGHFTAPSTKKGISVADKFNHVLALADHFVNYVSTGLVEPLKVADVNRLNAALKEDKKAPKVEEKGEEEAKD